MTVRYDLLKYSLRRATRTVSAAMLLVGIANSSGLAYAQGAAQAPPDNASPANAQPASSAPIPASVLTITKHAEGVYSAANARRWREASQQYSLLKAAVAKLPADVPAGNDYAANLVNSTQGVKNFLDIRDRWGTMGAANTVTIAAANLSTLYRRPFPVEIDLVEAFGREMQLGARARKIGIARAAALKISQTWEKLRPKLTDHKAATEAQRWDTLVSKIEHASTYDAYSRYAQAIMQRARYLEKLFS